MKPSLALVFTALLLSTNLSLADSSSISSCGHKEHDSMSLRHQAAVETHWREDKASNEHAWVKAKILGFNDFHGQLEPRSLFGRPAGGAAVLAAYLDAEREEVDGRAIIVHAGDHVGATPPVSALLQDEPSITFLNLVSNKHCRQDDDDDDQDEKARRVFSPHCDVVGTLGNHEFDEGVSEMLRLVNGGNHANGPFLEAEYTGAHFPYIVANVVEKATEKSLLPAYSIKRVKGIPIAFIGLVLKETPSIVTPSGVAGVEFLDEAKAANSVIHQLKKKGIHAFVITIHQGTSQDFYSGATHADAFDVGGSLGPIISELDDDVDIVVAGHWHRFTNALMENKNGKQILVTQAFSRGTAYADIDIALDPKQKDIVAKSAKIVTTWGDEGPGLKPNSDVAELVALAAKRVEPLVNQVIGHAANNVTRITTDAGESALGNLIADAQRSAMGSEIAFMNAGGIRADIHAGAVSWGDLFTVQPFNNDVVSMDLTGQQIVAFLNSQWIGQPFARIAKPSGLRYTWDGNGTETTSDDRVIVDSIRIAGNPIDLNQVYRVTVNSFMASGGDNYAILNDGVNREVGPVDLAALIDFITQLPQPFGYAIEGRISRIN